MNHWKIICTEDWYPGLWRTWFRSQSVAVGWYAKWGFPLEGPIQPSKWARGWSQARNALKAIEAGDLIVVNLHGNRIGRVGEVVRKEIGDEEWRPLVPKHPKEPDGEMGRRILVRWLPEGPRTPDEVVLLPAGVRFSGGTVRRSLCRLRADEYQNVLSAVVDESNWVPVSGHLFSYEESLSDYIAANPNELEDGLLPFPSKKARELVFDDRSRLDVLLMDRDGTPVVVECKQHGPSEADIGQLRGYMEKATELTESRRVRGILVHGGARKLSGGVRNALASGRPVEVVQYRLRLDFASCT